MPTSSSHKEWKPAGIALPSKRKMPTSSLSDCFRWFLPWPMRSESRWSRREALPMAAALRQRSPSAPARSRSAPIALSEAKLHPAWADALAQAAPEDTIVSRAFSGRPGRSIATNYVRTAIAPGAPPPPPIRSNAASPRRCAVRPSKAATSTACRFGPGNPPRWPARNRQESLRSGCGTRRARFWRRAGCVQVKVCNFTGSCARFGCGCVRGARYRRRCCKVGRTNSVREVQDRARAGQQKGWASSELNLRSTRCLAGVERTNRQSRTGVN